MSGDELTKVTENDLKNVRQLIEKEINQPFSSPLHLTNVVSTDESINEHSNNFQFEENINFIIKDQIKKIISEQVKSWFEKNISEIISPTLRNYLINSRTDNPNKKIVLKKDKVNKKIVLKKNKINEKVISKSSEGNFSKMSLSELQSEILKKGIKLDKRNSSKTLISLLQKS